MAAWAAAKASEQVAESRDPRPVESFGTRELCPRWLEVGQSKGECVSEWVIGTVHLNEVRAARACHGRSGVRTSTYS